MKDIIFLANQVVTNKVKVDLGKAVLDVRMLQLKGGTDRAKKRAVGRANSWVKWVTDTPEAYECNRFRLFKGSEGKLTVVRGREVDI